MAGRRVTAGWILIDRCPLCSGTEWAPDSVPEPNLYSEKLADLLGSDEDRLLGELSNWRCARCDLVFKRRWLADSVLRALFSGSVSSHPKGWDVVLGRFSAAGFLATMERWECAVGQAATADVRRGERELLSIIDSITAPTGFDPRAVASAIRRRDTALLRAASDAIAASIGEPAAFKRFSGFRSAAMWEYLQDRTGGFVQYAEVGCPLWGLLPSAAETGCEATYLMRDEVNYWGSGCVSDGQGCSAYLLRDRRIRTARWDSPWRRQVVGVFQYLDHPTDPRRFLAELFDRADSAAIILDSMDAPVAVQHMTGWSDISIGHMAELFGKQVHADFGDIRASGNRLFLLTGRGGVPAR